MGEAGDGAVGVAGEGGVFEGGIRIYNGHIFGVAEGDYGFEFAAVDAGVEVEAGLGVAFQVVGGGLAGFDDDGGASGGGD